jgi:hypothetical protein
VKLFYLEPIVNFRIKVQNLARLHHSFSCMELKVHLRSYFEQVQNTIVEELQTTKDLQFYTEVQIKTE